MTKRRASILSFWGLGTAGALLGIHGCTNAPDAQPLAVNPDVPAERMIPASGQSRRVGGDMTATVTGTDGNYRGRSSSVTTPLPEGYPIPTPPGAIEVKSYPVVRRAEVEGTGNPDSGMNGTFWPLFKHIKKHEIAMTSPVEMDYPDGMGEWNDQSKWKMSFLYREREMNAEGQEGSVVVRDAKPLVVIAIGVRGDYTTSRMKAAKVKLDTWLGEHAEWKVAGAPRVLHYNGPTLAFWNKWSEVQVPVEPAASITAR